MSPQIAQFRPKNTNHLKTNINIMIGFGFYQFLLQNQIARVFFPLTHILLTDEKMPKKAFKKHKKCDFLKFFQIDC